jgi:hypothetical protein
MRAGWLNFCVSVIPSQYEKLQDSGNGHRKETEIDLIHMITKSCFEPSIFEMISYKSYSDVKIHYHV